MTTTVVALGGHLLAGREAELDVGEALAPLGDGPLVVTHGNGPQVGAGLERDPHAPVHVAVARTQAEIGGPLALALGGACVVTHVVVDEDDPAFAEPSKPIGPSYGREEAEALAAEQGWAVAEDGHRGWRRVVPSPAPLEVVEVEAIRTLLSAGTAVVACGGGGIPVARGPRGLTGLAAVIDKDRSSALLAELLGARRLVVLTDVDAVYRDFRGPDAEALRELGAADAEALLPELRAGSMRPKVEACAAFVRRTGGEAVVTSAEALAEAVAGRAGTRIR